MTTAQKIKDILITLATCDQLPLDINELDIEVFKKALSTYNPQEGHKFSRKCDITGEGMDEGWVVQEDTHIKYYIDLVEYLYTNWNVSLEEAVKEEEDLEMLDKDTSHMPYWTQWEVEEDAQYIFSGGELTDI